MLVKAGVSKFFLFVLLVLVSKSELSSSEKRNSDIVNFNEVIDLIEKGLKDPHRFKNNNELAIVLGLPGTGKSTLINYLNKVPLKCYKNENNKWLIDLANSTRNEHDYLKIDHDQKSVKSCPHIFYTVESNIDYVESRALQTIDNTEKKLAASFLNKKLLEKYENLKFILLLDFEDVNMGNGEKAKSSFKQLFQLLGASKTNPSHLAKSIAIVFTKSIRQNKQKHQIMQELYRKLGSILEDKFKKDKNFKTIYEQISKGQFALFSNPQQSEILSEVEKDFILNNVIEKLSFISRRDVEIKLSVNEIHMPSVIHFISQTNDEHERKYLQSFKEELPVRIPLFLSYSIMFKLVSQFEKFYWWHKNTFGMSSFTGKSLSLKQEELMSFINMRDFINFLIDKLREKLPQAMDKSDKFRDQFQIEFNLQLDKKFKQLQSDLEHKLNEIISKFSKLELECESVNEMPLVRNEELVTLLKEKEFVRSIMAIDKKSMDNKLIHKFNEILDKINNQSIDSLQYDEESKNLIFKGPFLSMSKFAQKLKEFKTQISGLKRIHVFASNCFKFDSNFKIDRKYYTKDAPDLVIISPNVIVRNNSVIDLSCENTPPYPDNQKHARDAVGYIEVTFLNDKQNDDFNLTVISAKENDIDGLDGMYGKNGLPGYKGGDLHIFTENLKKVSEIMLVSRGGNGGPGQFGGQGSRGKNGTDAILSQVEFCSPAGVRCKQVKPELVAHLSRKPNSQHATWKCIKRGTAGGLGGRGGMGGKGGVGGLHGQFVVYTLKNEKNGEYIKVSNEISNVNQINGKPGANGDDGQSQRGGYYGRIGYRLVNTEKGCMLLGGEHFDSQNFYNELRTHPHSYQTKDRFIHPSKSIRVSDVVRSGLDYIREISNQPLPQNNKNFVKNLIKMYLSGIKSVKLPFTANAPLVHYMDFVHFMVENRENQDVLMIVKNVTADHLFKFKKLPKNENYLLNFAMATLLIKLQTLSKQTLVVYHPRQMVEMISNQVDELQEVSHDDTEKLLEPFYKKQYEQNLMLRIDDVVCELVSLNDDLQRAIVEKQILMREAISKIVKIKKQSSKSKEKLNELKKFEKIFLDNFETKKLLVIMRQYVQSLLQYGRKDMLVGRVAYIGLNPKHTFLFEEDLKIKIAQTDDFNQVNKYNTEFNESKDKIKIEADPFVETQEDGYTNEEVSEIQEFIRVNSKYLETMRIVDSMIRGFLSDIKNDRNFHKLYLYLNKNRNYAALDYNNYNFKPCLEYLASNLVIVRELLVEKSTFELFTFIERVEKGIRNIREVDDNIIDLITKVEFLYYLHEVKNCAFDEAKITCLYQEALVNLRISLKERIVYERYMNSLQAFNLFSFPFFCTDISSLERTDKTTSSNLDKVKLYSTNANHLKNLISSSTQKQNRSIDKDIVPLEFDESSPFFRWTSSRNRFEITSLFKGFFTTLFASASYSKYDLIKFNNISIRIEAKSEEENQKLQEILKDFFIEFIHPSESYYRLNNQIHLISSHIYENVTLQLAHQIGSSGNSNFASKQLLKSRPLQSPFTFWQMRIKSYNPQIQSKLFPSIQELVKRNPSLEFIISLFGSGDYLKSSSKPLKQPNQNLQC